MVPILFGVIDSIGAHPRRAGARRQLPDGKGRAPYGAGGFALKFFEKIVYWSLTPWLDIDRESWKFYDFVMMFYFADLFEVFSSTLEGSGP